MGSGDGVEVLGQGLDLAPDPKLSEISPLTLTMTKSCKKKNLQCVYVEHKPVFSKMVFSFNGSERENALRIP